MYHWKIRDKTDIIAAIGFIASCALVIMGVWMIAAGA